VCILVTLFFSCNRNSKVPERHLQNQMYQSPKTVEAINPSPVIIDTCPKPQTIIIPVSPGTYNEHTKSGNISIPLSPPETKPASFFLHMQNYSTDNGLALDAISCSCIDHIGNLWFGSYGGGVSRYDGKSFTNFTTEQGLGDNSILSVIEDKKGNLWFGTHGGGVSCYDGKSFITFTTAQGLSNNSVWSILEDKKGNFWFGTGGGGVSRYDGKSFITYTTVQGLANNNVLSIVEDKKGNLWFGTHAGVSRYDGKSFITYSMEQGLCNNSVWSIVEDKTGNMWFGTGGGVSRYNGKSFVNYTPAQGMGINSVHSILEDKKGNLWFGTGGGVSCFDGKSIITYTTEQGLSNNSVWTILEDKTGNLWFGTHGGGVNRYDGKSFTTYTTAQGLGNNNVFSILEDQAKNLWFGTGGGASFYDGKTFTNYTSAQGLGKSSVLSILEDKKRNIWFGTQGGGVSCYNGKSFTTYTSAQGLGNNTVFSILEDRKENLWLGTYGGVSRFDGKTFTTYTTTQGLGNNSVWCIMEDKAGNLWFGTDGGASCYNGKTFTTYTMEQGLGNNTVFSMVEDNSGNIWFGTQGGGVSRFDGKSFTTYKTEEGLPDNDVAGIVIDKQGNIVIGTNVGIAVLKSFAPYFQGENAQNKIPAQNNISNEVLRKFNPVFKIYNSKTGYPVKNVNGGSDNGAMLCDSKGNIWVGTGSEKTALVWFDPATLNKNPNPPTVVIQNIKIDEENICWYTIAQSVLNGTTYHDSAMLAQQEIMTYGKVLTEDESDTMRKNFGGIQFDGIAPFYPLPEHLALPHQYNHITFDFNAIEPSKPYLVRYQYILENYDKNWSPVSRKTTATFGNIYEGNYTFKVRAQSPEGIWSEPVTYTFEVLPPVYRTWWAYSLYATAAFLLLLGLYRWRTASLRKEKEVLEKTVDERTAELVEKNKEVVNQKELVEKQKELVEEKNKDILDSIAYAKRLQDAILPPLSIIRQFFPESFVLYKPKDIVAGDFYWMERQGDNILIAAADCTGHGVPGALVSVICSNALNRTVKEFNITETGRILDKVRELVLETFEKSESNVRDGMDISLCCLNTRTSEIQWSGAYNSLWYIHKGEMHEVPADKQPIGKVDKPQPFNTHNLNLQKGDTLYLFTDGYADQFGGPKDKKFSYKQLEGLLMENSGKAMEEQKKILDGIFNEWKGRLEQVDDILVIGIRV